MKPDTDPLVLAAERELRGIEKRITAGTAAREKRAEAWHRWKAAGVSTSALARISGVTPRAVADALERRGLA